MQDEATNRMERVRSLKLGKPRVQSAQNVMGSPRGEYLENLEIKPKWFTQARRARIITSSNRCHLFSLSITRGALP